MRLKKAIVVFLFYCTVQGQGYFCNTGYEIRKFPGDSGNPVAMICRQYASIDNMPEWMCFPIDKNAIILDEVKDDKR